jgi:hypothetical protein
MSNVHPRSDAILSGLRLALQPLEDLTRAVRTAARQLRSTDSHSPSRAVFAAGVREIVGCLRKVAGELELIAESLVSATAGPET